MRHELLYIGTIAFGLVISTRYAEWPVNLVCWGIFLEQLRRGGRSERIEMMTVLAFATPMELFFSEVWLIYEYQRDLMPLYVPVGHWFLYDLGRRLSTHMTERAALPSILILLPLVGLGAFRGTDTSAAVLMVVVIGFVVRGPEPRLYATMVWCALAMELWGTWLGAWRWAADVPWTNLTAWNPPLLVGGFYALGDLLVNLTVRWLGPQEVDGPVMISDAVDAA